jgi:hypothetical protein
MYEIHFFNKDKSHPHAPPNKAGNTQPNPISLNGKFIIGEIKSQFLFMTTSHLT